MRHFQRWNLKRVLRYRICKMPSALPILGCYLTPSGVHASTKVQLIKTHILRRNRFGTKCVHNVNKAN